MKTEDAYTRLKTLSNYSETYRNLADSLANKNKVMSMSFDYADEKIPDFMKHYEYPVSAVPVIISQKDIKKHNRFIERIIPLIYRALDVYFKGDESLFSRYLNEPEFLLPLILNTPYEPGKFFIRYDALFSDNEFKVLEINVGSTVGGWQHDWLSPVTIENLHNATDVDRSNVSHHNVTKAMFSSLYKEISKDASRTSANVLIFTSEQTDFQTESFKAEYRKVWANTQQSLRGQLYFFDNFDDLVFTNQGELHFEGEKIDAILLTMAEGIFVPNEIMLKLLTCSMRNNLVFPDNPAITIVGNKSVLALVHETKFLASLNQEDVSFIQSHIPWTSKVEDKEILWQGTPHSLLSFLQDKKEQLVVKKARSQQGKDVYVGRYCSPGKWNEAIEKALQGHDWIVQQYCESDEFLCLDADGKLLPTKPVWGVFDIDSAYSGAFLRAELTDSQNGVINSSNGAIEFMVLEENPVKRKRLML
ncbi:hypothetical protein [Planctobacterium marinum]|uniref:hypothetical protein n=1 Tax=Planctobacterium marinum TaxID=1631968 RepID=UPI001E39D2E3|nr:hypothetical protein [Planctobacterium marinum]MCC2606942.1 hypothetical protein [Planctobacterium marinum]